MKSRFIRSLLSAAAALLLSAASTPFTVVVNGGTTPTVNETFSGWTGNPLTDGIFRVNGNWSGSGGNTIEQKLASVATNDLTLTEIATAGCPGTLSACQASEIQTLANPGFGYGYYEVMIKPSCHGGGVASFFVMQVGYVSPEFDIEFLLNTPNTVDFTDHPLDGSSFVYNLGFNPCQSFNTYGILWVNNGNGTATVSNTVNGTVVHSRTGSQLLKPAIGMLIMANTWSGNANFGGTAPAAPGATTTYQWIKFYAGATAPVP